MNSFQKAGEDCGNCIDRWTVQDKPPVKLVALPTRSENQIAEIAICPYCDGPIFEVAIDALRREADADAPQP